MRASIKQWVSVKTIEICKEAYGLESDREGNLQSPEGKVIKWAIRDGKPQESWVFALTIAMGLSSAVNQAPEEIAQLIAGQLNNLGKSSWQFKCAGAYINAYFEPKRVEDYFVDKKLPDWERLKQLNPGSYGYYRLGMIEKSLEAKGVSFERSSSVEIDLKTHPLHTLFNFPDSGLNLLEKETEAWENWLDRVCKMTILGDLRGLTPEMETELFIFIKACLQR